MTASGLKLVREQLRLESERYYSCRGNIADYPVLGFMRALSLCHSGMIDDDGDYQASSPDEIALLEGARDAGLTFQERKHNRLSVYNSIADAIDYFT